MFSIRVYSAQNSGTTISATPNTTEPITRPSTLRLLRIFFTGRSGNRVLPASRKAPSSAPISSSQARALPSTGESTAPHRADRPVSSSQPRAQRGSTTNSRTA